MSAVFAERRRPGIEFALRSVTLALSAASQSQDAVEGRQTMAAPAKLKKTSLASGRRKVATKIHPQLAQLASVAPEGDEWLHEIKYDGYRILCEIRDGTIRLTTRNQLDWTERLPHLAAAAAKLKVRNAVLDGEITALNTAGVTDFQALQLAFKEQRDRQLCYYVFDLLTHNDEDLRDQPLEQRKAKLEKILAKNKSGGVIRFSEHVIGNGPQFFAEAAKLGLEGIICKRRLGKWHAGRAADWLKVKHSQREEFIICGYTDPSGSRKGLGALLLGYHDSENNLCYAGKVGTGFDDASLGALERRLRLRTRKKAPFRDGLDVPRGTHWVVPELVAQIAFSNWTRDGMLRHPVFLGLRADKSPREVRHEP